MTGPAQDVAGHARSGTRLFPILLVNFMGTLGFGLVLPLLVFLVVEWGGNSVIYGIAGATYSFFQLIGAPVLGRWSDRYGRKRILLLSQVGTLLSWLVFLGAFALPNGPLAGLDLPVLGRFTLTLPLLALVGARALDGLTGGNVSVANAYLADVSPAPERAANFGRMAVSGNLGFIVGPALAGLLGATAWRAVGPVLFAAVIALMACIAISAFLPESNLCILAGSPERPGVRKLLGQEQRDCFTLRAAPSLGWRTLSELKGVRPMLTIYFLVMLGFNLFYVAFPTYVASDLGWSLAQVGTFFTVLSALMVVVQGPVLGRLTPRFGEKTLAISGGIFLTASFMPLTSSSMATVYAGTALMALGNGLMWPMVTSLLSVAAGERYQGAVQGLAGGLGAGASIAGLLAGGFLYRSLGPHVLWVSAAVLLAGTAITAAGPPSALLGAAPHRQQHGDPEEDPEARV